MIYQLSVYDGQGRLWYFMEWPQQKQQKQHSSNASTFFKMSKRKGALSSGGSPADPTSPGHDSLESGAGEEAALGQQRNELRKI